MGKKIDEDYSARPLSTDEKSTELSQVACQGFARIATDVFLKQFVQTASTFSSTRYRKTVRIETPLAGKRFQ